MKCFGCKQEIEVGDRYIEDTSSGFSGQEANPEIDDLVAELFSGRDDGKIVFCSDCTQEGGDYISQTYYGEDDE